MHENPLYDFDDILNKVGDFGPYQWLMYFLICLPASVPSAFSAFNQVFVAATPSHKCRKYGRTYFDNGDQISPLYNVTSEIVDAFEKRWVKYNVLDNFSNYFDIITYFWSKQNNKLMQKFKT